MFPILSSCVSISEWMSMTPIMSIYRYCHICITHDKINPEKPWLFLLEASYVTKTTYALNYSATLVLLYNSNITYIYSLGHARCNIYECGSVTIVFDSLVHDLRIAYQSVGAVETMMCRYSSWF